MGSISKFRYYFPNKNTQDQEKNILDQRGQSLVEFVLLLSVIMLTSLLFLKLVNTNVAKYWLAMGRVLAEDPSQTINLR
tara:strand:- start:245391 stop:245627 length:237 start_codon:yes stop_codon:yes gene_type:complete